MLWFAAGAFVGAFVVVFMYSLLAVASERREDDGED